MCVRLKNEGNGAKTPKPQSVKNMQEKVQSNRNEMAKVYFYNGKGKEGNWGRKARGAVVGHKFPANLRWLRVLLHKTKGPRFPASWECSKRWKKPLTKSWPKMVHQQNKNDFSLHE